jgi:hypothetical protein
MYCSLDSSRRDTGNYQGDVAAADNLIRQYLKEKGHSKVAAGRGLKQVSRRKAGEGAQLHRGGVYIGYVPDRHSCNNMCHSS